MTVTLSYSQMLKALETNVKLTHNKYGQEIAVKPVPDRNGEGILDPRVY